MKHAFFRGVMKHALLGGGGGWSGVVTHALLVVL